MIVWAVWIRDLRLVARRPADVLLPLFFFVAAASLFPFGVGSQWEMLRAIGAGVVWVSALLATLLSLQALYAPDHADGTLEQMVLSGRSLLGLVLVRGAVHWLAHGLPLMVVSPALALLFDLDGPSAWTLVLSLLLGTPTLSLLGSLGAALTLGARGAGMLTVLIVLPLTVPCLIFGAGAVAAARTGDAPQGHVLMLAALFLLTLLVAPWATSAALRMAMDE